MHTLVFLSLLAVPSGDEVEVRAPAWLDHRSITRGFQYGSLTVDERPAALHVIWLPRADAIARETGQERASFAGKGWREQRLVWPHEVCSVRALGSEAILAAYTTQAGEIVIERRELVWPETMPEPVTDQPNGEASVEFVPLDFGETHELLRRPARGEHPSVHIESISRRGEEPSRLLVLLSPGSELWTLDLESSCFEPLASGLEHSGRLGYVPELSQFTWIGFDSYDDAALGRVYVLDPWSGCVIDERHRWIAWIDRDADGELDECRLFDFVDRMAFVSGDPRYLELRTRFGR